MRQFSKSNPRFVWCIGSIREVYPDIPEFDDVEDGCVLYDRQERKKVVTIHYEYTQMFCLELNVSPASMPMTSLENWLNGLSKTALESENIPGTK